MVSTVIVQKVGAGMVTSASCYWDATTDGCLSSTFETAQMTCIMTVFACAV
jgi:dynein light chain Tctex-type 1